MSQKKEAVIRISREDARTYLEMHLDEDPSEKQIDKFLETAEECFNGPEKDLEEVLEVVFDQWYDWEKFR